LVRPTPQLLCYNDTKKLINALLTGDVQRARPALHKDLLELRSNDGEFYESIAKHAPFINLTSAQWFDLFSKLPNRIFWTQIAIDKVLSEEQIKKLPSITG
jgi:hypothetical protein